MAGLVVVVRSQRFRSALADETRKVRVKKRQKAERGRGEKSVFAEGRRGRVSNTAACVNGINEPRNVGLVKL